MRNEQLIPDIHAIARHLYGDDDKPTIRKVRNQIERHGLPVVHKGGYTWSFDTWLDRWQRGEEVVVGNGR